MSDGWLRYAVEKTAESFAPIQWAGNPVKIKEKGHLLDFARAVLIHGADPKGENPLGNAGIAVISPYGLPIVHPKEISGVNETLVRIRSYLDEVRTRSYVEDDHAPRPLNIVLLAPPGGGKSTAAHGFARAIKQHGIQQGSALKYLRFNVSQYDSVDDFRRMWDMVRYESALKPVLCFIDEFDVGHFRWIPQFLAPMNDGMTFEPQERKFGPVVFVFGGGVFDSQAKLKNEARRFTRYDKLPDFVRRVDVWLDLMPVAYPWENTQFDDKSMSAPLPHEVMSERNFVFDWDRKQLILRPSGRHAAQPNEVGSLNPSVGFDFAEQKLVINGKEVTWRWEASGVRQTGNDDDGINSRLVGDHLGSIAEDSPAAAPDHDAGESRKDELGYEIFFALLKRALFLRNKIEARGKGSERSDRRPHRFDIESNKWIDKDVALFLLHPAMRLRDGLGSLEKFIQMIDFQLEPRFEWKHLPYPSEYKELLAIGPEFAAGGWTPQRLQNEMNAIRAKDSAKIAWPPGLHSGTRP